MIRKLPSGKYRLYSRKIESEDRPASQSRHLRQAAPPREKHERAVQYFKRH